MEDATTALQRAIRMKQDDVVVIELATVIAASCSCRCSMPGSRADMPITTGICKASFEPVLSYARPTHLRLVLIRAGSRRRSPADAQLFRPRRRRAAANLVYDAGGVVLHGCQVKDGRPAFLPLKVSELARQRANELQASRQSGCRSRARHHVQVLVRARLVVGASALSLSERSDRWRRDLLHAEAPRTKRPRSSTRAPNR